LSSAVVAALVAGGVSLVVSVVTALNARRLQEVRLRAESDNARAAQEAAFRAQEVEIHAEAERARIAQEAALRTQEERLRAELRTEFMAEEAIRLLLEHPQWKLRSFDEIKRRVRGFEDDELRQLLVRSGAIAFDYTRGGLEMWGLRERNRDQLM
jgi:hypothetical protein